MPLEGTIQFWRQIFTSQLILALQKELPEQPQHRMRHKREHETLSQKREDMRLHQQCWPKCSVLPPPWPKLLVLTLCLLLVFLYCQSPVTEQNKNESVKGRTGRCGLHLQQQRHFRWALNACEVKLKLLQSSILSISSSEWCQKARCFSKLCPIHMFSRDKAKSQ